MSMIDSVCSCMESDVYLLHLLHTYLNMLGIFVCKNDFIWTGALTQEQTYNLTVSYTLSVINVCFPTYYRILL